MSTDENPTDSPEMGQDNGGAQVTTGTTLPPVSQDEIKTKIKAQGKILDELSEQGRRIQAEQQRLNQQMSQIIVRSNKAVGAIESLQGLPGISTDVKK